MMKSNDLERAVTLQAHRVGANGAVLVVLDGDRDCAATLGKALRARIAREDVRVGVVVAVREYEAWLLASAASLAGHRGLPPDMTAPPDVETLGSPKAWLAARLPHRYSETVDQPALTARVDVGLAASAPSFRKLLRELSRLLAADLVQGAQ
jgi:hypothetical protein